MLKFTLFFVLTLSLISAACAESVKIIDDPSEAYKVRMELLESAKEEIQISYFIFAHDDTAMQVLSLLRKKAREGVKVKVMIDALFNEIPKDVGTHLLHENVQIKNFNTFDLLRLGKMIKFRMHDKMFIVDQQKIILGGRNIEDTYYGKAPKNYDDRDVYLVGDIAREASSYYNDLWKADHLKLMKQKRLKNTKASDKLDEALKNYEMNKSLDQFELTAWESDMIHIEDVDLLHDEVASRKKKMSGTAKNLYELIKNAKVSVLIDSPYLIISKELEVVLKEAIARNVKIRILTNSLKSTDGLLPQAAYIGQRKNIVGMGIELFEYYADESFHSKSLVVDNEIAVIGSFNFDPRSQNLNTETMVIMQDSKLAGLLTESMNESLKQSYRIDANGRPEGHDQKLPGVSLRKKVITRLIQFLIVPFIKDIL